MNDKVGLEKYCPWCNTVACGRVKHLPKLIDGDVIKCRNCNNNVKVIQFLYNTMRYVKYDS